MKDARTHDLYARDCEKCGCPLTFQRTPDGKIVPLDLRAQCYQIMDDSVVPTTMAFVTHFSTCKFASDFSHKETA